MIYLFCMSGPKENLGGHPARIDLWKPRGEREGGQGEGGDKVKMWMGFMKAGISSQQAEWGLGEHPGIRRQGQDESM